ncbi:MAG: hypothetical protein H3C55_09905 [Pseudorhodoplanes sp.]|jgi:hypothetical protein|nr:hypothetical protein [Pseudorhodoplanes sp.]MBW7949652.1 hypothetical protein [Pseudorhodoplanes sp.]GIK82207.1 MAG: hypothetical protein BroJett024_33120 [Alphaproteobacteria bacterium]
MCLACEEEAFYRAYLDHMANRARETATADAAVPAPSSSGRPQDEKAQSAPNDKS